MNNIPYIKYKNIYIIPTFHSRIEFTKLVRTAYFMVFPDVIAVELPDNIRNEVIEGIERLPYLSLIAYADTLNPKRMNFVPIDPGDSIIEAISIGLEFGIPIEFIDLSITDYLPPSFKLPDDYSLNKIGLPLFYQKISKYFEKEYKSKKIKLRDKLSLEEYLKNQEKREKEFDFIEKDVLRERYMASHLLKIMPLYHRILFIVGMAHWDNIKYYLENPEKIQDVELDLIPHKVVNIYNVKSKDARFLLRELPYNTHRWLKFKEKYSKEILEDIASPDDLYEILESYNKIDHIRKIFLKAKYEYE